MKTIKGIYVPGLGDSRSMGQDDALKAWKKYGIDFEYYPVGWAKGSFKPKLEKLVATIDDLHRKHGEIVLMGSSAGASAIINAYVQSKSKVRCLVYISGKIQNTHTISESVFDRNKAFKESLDILPSSLDKLTEKDLRKILSVHPWADGRVPVSDTKIKGVREITLPVLGHVTSIIYALTLGKKRIAKFITSG